MDVRTQFDSNAALFIALSSNHLVPIGSATGGGSNNRRTITSEIECRDARVTEKGQNDYRF